MNDLRDLHAYVDEIQQDYEREAETQRKLDEKVAQEETARRQRREKIIREEAARDRLRAIRLSYAYEKSRLACITLCNAIHTAFPYEIRALIYDHLVSPGVLHNVLEARDEQGNVRINSNPLISTSFFFPRSRIPEVPSIRREVWKYVEYTGNMVGKEIAERWYETACFVVYAEDDLFSRLLTTDVWERDVVPANNIRHVRFIVPAHLVEREDIKKFKNPRAQVFENFGLLRRLRNQKAVIELVFSHVDVNTLRHMHSVLYALKEDGYVGIKVLGPEGGDLRKDLSHVFDMERREFDEVFGKVDERVYGERLRRMEEIIGREDGRW